jgi:hypothetical protein
MDLRMLRVVGLAARAEKLQLPGERGPTDATVIDKNFAEPGLRHGVTPA